MKLNEMNMVTKFEEKTWYNIDLILNWEESKVSIYVNGEAKTTANFFINEKKNKNQEKGTLKANAISIYGLSPGGTSQFSNIKMCNEICDEKKENNLKYLGGVARYALSSLALGSALALIF